MGLSDDLPSWTKPRGDAPVTVVLGAMNFGKRTPKKDAEAIVKRALERGVALFDTANAYNDGESERILGAALKEKGAIATKVGFGRIAGKPEGLSAARIRVALDESLGRLGRERADLYYFHVPDHATHADESVAAMGELLASGKVRAFGVSNYASWQHLELVHACDRLGVARPVVSQQLYNLLIRQLDLEYFRFARRYGVHTTVYNPLAGGLLTGRYRAGDAIAKGSRFDKNQLYQGRYWSPRMIALAGEYEALGREAGIGPVELAYTWLAGSSGVDSILVGPATVAQLDQALDAIVRVLEPPLRARIDAIHRAFVGTETSYAR